MMEQNCRKYRSKVGAPEAKPKVNKGFILF